jgi:hypothetical protein
LLTGDCIAPRRLRPAPSDPTGAQTNSEGTCQGLAEPPVCGKIDETPLHRSEISLGFTCIPDFPPSGGHSGPEQERPDPCPPGREIQVPQDVAHHTGIGERERHQRRQSAEEVEQAEDEMGGALRMRPPPAPGARGRRSLYTTLPSGRRGLARTETLRERWGCAWVTLLDAAADAGIVLREEGPPRFGAGLFKHGRAPRPWPPAAPPPRHRSPSRSRLASG